MFKNNKLAINYEDQFYNININFNIFSLEQIIQNSFINGNKNSYTKKISNNKTLLLTKIIEESNEVWCASNSKNKYNLIYELADLIYFLIILCVSNGIKINLIFNKIINKYNSNQLNLNKNLNDQTIKLGLCLNKYVFDYKKYFEFFKLNGINIEMENNKKLNVKFINQKNIKIKSFFIKPKDVHKFMEKNLMNAVICYEDILENYPCNYKKINLIYDSNEILPSKICVISHKNFDLNIYKKNKLKKLVIFSEYNYLTNKWVEENELTAKIVIVNGANEGHLICNLCDLIVCVSSTGETIKANNLQILEKIYVNNLGFYVKPELQEEIQNIINKEK